MNQKKKKRKAWRWLLAVVALFVIFVILGAAIKVPLFDKAWNKTADGFEWLGRKIKGIWPWKKKERIEPARFLPEGKKTANYLLAVTKQVNGIKQLSTLVLASYDSRNDSGSIIYFPGNLMVDVPGAGPDQLSNLIELDEGRISMTLVAVENMMGIEVDRYILGSDRDLSIVFSKLGEKYTVSVPKKVSFDDKSLNVKVNLEPGKQVLDGRKLASYLTYSEPGKELELIERQRDFVPVFLATYSRGASYNSIEQFTKQNANLVDSDASSKEMAGLLQAFALLKKDRLQQATVPVKEFRVEKTVVLSVDMKKLPAFMKKYVKSEGSQQPNPRVRVEILNGCGVPGISEKVASQLDLDKVYVVNTANADNFNHADTVVLLYSDDKKMAQAASDIKKSLEVGRIESRPKTQDVTDITVVVGKDYASK